MSENWKKEVFLMPSFCEECVKVPAARYAGARIQYVFRRAVSICEGAVAVNVMRVFKSKLSTLRCIEPLFIIASTEE